MRLGVQAAAILSAPSLAVAPNVTDEAMVVRVENREPF